MIMSGVKTILYVVGGLVIGALTLATGFVPEGLASQALWTWVVLPVIAGIIAMLKNWKQHKNDPVK